MTPEAIVSAAVRAMLEARQLARGVDSNGDFLFWFRRMNAAPTLIGTGRFVKNKSSGFPDYLCIDQLWGGRCAWIELKAPGARKRANEKAQNETIAAFDALGVPVIRADSVRGVELALAAWDCVFGGGE